MLGGVLGLQLVRVGGCGLGGVSREDSKKTVVDVASPKARSQQANGGKEKAAVCAEELIDVRCTKLEGASRLDARNKVDDDEDVS